MSKFGLMDEDDAAAQAEPQAPPSLSDRLSQFRRVERRPVLDVKASDAAAAVHGFTSREPAPSRQRRRRAPVEPTRHLAIRLTESQYNRFVAYADRYQLTYHDALDQLMSQAGS